MMNHVLVPDKAIPVPDLESVLGENLLPRLTCRSLRKAENDFVVHDSQAARLHFSTMLKKGRHSL